LWACHGDFLGSLGTLPVQTFVLQISFKKAPGLNRGFLSYKRDLFLRSMRCIVPIYQDWRSDEDG
jgi:hypothetical protein